MLSWIVVIEHYLNDIALLQDYAVGIDAVDGGVRGTQASAKSGVKSGYDRANISYVVEEGTGKSGE